jgi:hypothetical protein
MATSVFWFSIINWLWVACTLTKEAHKAIAEIMIDFFMMKDFDF